jgi:3-hydroxyisobutyrate dehydrogenase
MVGLPKDVRQVVLGEQGALKGASRGKLLIDMTTSEPSLAVEIHEQAAAVGVASLDAPVSGGDVGAQAGTLSIMVGGEEAAFAAALPLLEVLGKTIRHQGPAGAGQHTKMVNQMLIGPMMLGVCEALLYAERAGLDRSKVIESVGQGAAGSWCINHLGPRILKRDFEPGFFVEHFIKDLGIALQEGEHFGLQLPGLELAKKLYESVADAGYAHKGTQALMLELERLNSVD